MRRTYKGDDSSENLINLTPLIDVVFVILIAFIMIAPLLDVDSISLASGSTKTIEKPLKTDKGDVHIDIHKDGSVRINKRDIEAKDIPVLLQALYHANNKVIPKVFCDKSASFGAYQKVKNAIEDAGFDQMDIVLTQQ